MSLDYLGHNNSSNMNGSNHEDWSQFLSTSMAALATGDADEGAEADEHHAGHESEELFAQHQQDVMDAAVAVATSPRSLSSNASQQVRKSSPTAASNRAMSAIKIDTFGLEPRVPQQGDDFMLLGGIGGKARSDSISEALTSSTESSPSGAAWRPLGRRVTPQNGGGGNSSSGALANNNLTEHLSVFEMPAFSHPLGSSSSEHAKKLHHTSSFRDGVTSCLSSSGSSLYESSSSDEEPQDPTINSLPDFHTEEPLPPQAFRMMMRKGSAPAMSMRPSIIDVDPSSFAESSLPVLSSLPAHPRSLSIDNSFVSSMAHHAKSPVLGNRKDSQTWQLQDEEFLKTSPRFGALHGDMSSVFGSSGLLSEGSDLSNQLSDNNEPRARFTKDMRASSVDFTYISSSRSPTNVNPPLPPPPHEPLQRLRAKSFSYSSVYGSSAFSHPPPGHGYNSSSMKQQQQYAPLPSHHQQQQRQPTLHDYHGNMRAYHHPSGSPPPVSSPPPSGGVRPPRVSIPSDSPMHQQYHTPQQHQYGPPQYRRYSSDTFATVPPYPADMYNEQENQARHSNSSSGGGSGPSSGNGRGVRSYSMENPNFPATRPFRSQSMEGSQLFAAGPPLEYPSMTRTNSAGMGYDWPRGPMDVNGPSPPLPPDSRGGGSHHSHSHHSSNAGHHFPSPPPEAYYEVEFKRGRQEIFAGNALFTPGDYVKVEADRGEDIGRIVQRSTDLAKLHSGNGSSSNNSNNEPATSPNDDGGLSRAKRHDVPAKKIIAVANQRERDMLAEQRKEEHEVFEVCKSKVRQRLLPMNVIDAEYQFDRHKLTFFFEADRCVHLMIITLLP